MLTDQTTKRFGLEIWQNESDDCLHEKTQEIQKWSLKFIH